MWVLHFLLFAVFSAVAIGCGVEPKDPEITDTDTDSTTSLETDDGGEDSVPDSDSDPESSDGQTSCTSGDLLIDEEGARFDAACDGSSLQLVPFVQIAGAWLGGGENGPCQKDADRLSCPAGDKGYVVLEVDGPHFQLTFEASEDVVVEALAAKGTMELRGARGWLSNGFQSWSQSGVIQIGEEPTSKILTKALTDTGEDEVYRRGKHLSWWYTFAGGAGAGVSFFAGATTANRFRSWIHMHKLSAQDTFHVALTSGGRERVSLSSSESLSGERWRIQFGEDLEDILREYGQRLATRRKEKPVLTPVGWNSWYDLWSGVRETDIVESGREKNADLLLSILGSRVPGTHQPMVVVLDDGWEKAWGDWTPNERFPSGIEGLATKVKELGLRFGIWIAPFLVSTKTAVYKDHPEWFLGEPANPEIKIEYDHPAHLFEPMAVLDVTHPDAATHLRGTIKTLVEAGVEFLKIDFLFAGTWEGQRAEDLTGVEAYRRGLEIIRQAAGETVEILAVGAPPLPTFEYVDGWRLGCDIAFEPFLGISNMGIDFIANEARFFTSRWPLCLATLCDADPPLLRELPYAQVDLGAWVAVATGGALFLSDDLTKLPLERREWALDAQKLAIGIGGESAVPESFFPDEIPVELRNMNDRNNPFYTVPFRIPNVWRMPDGTRVGLNFQGAPVTIEGVSIPKTSAKELP